MGLLNLADGDIVIEVGAGYGLWAAQVASSGCILHTFEPNTANRAIAYERLNGFKNVTLWPYALGGSDRTASLYCTGLKSTLTTDGEKCEECTVVSLNHFLVHNRIGEVFLLRLDCNGAEVEILEQALELGLTKRIKRILVGTLPRGIEEKLSQTHRHNGWYWERIGDGLA
jgi:FkbM family methyltransferase